jgi:hypothetical protein
VGTTENMFLEATAWNIAYKRLDGTTFMHGPPKAWTHV